MNNNAYNEFANQDFKSLSAWLFSLNPYEFSLIASILGFAISTTLTVDQQNSLGNFMELLGQVILTINAQSSTLQRKQNKHKNIKPIIESSNLEEEIIKIKEELIKLRHDTFVDKKF